MKKFYVILTSLSILIFCACSSDTEDLKQQTIVPVEVTLNGLDIAVQPDAFSSQRNMRATASEAGVTRIAFKVYDSNGKEVYKEEKYSGTDEDFDHVKMPLHVGKYTFVAVAHKARITESSVANITSATEASLPELYIPSITYATKLDVEVKGNTSQSVTMNFGKRITATFRLVVTDTYPDDVEKIQITSNPTKDAAKTPYAFNPTTGLAPTELSYTVEFLRSNAQSNNFTGKRHSLVVFLTEEEQTADILINMLNAKNEVLYTRTLHNVPLRQHRTTTATGTFFTSSVTGDFTFDNTDDPEVNIPLKE